VFVALSKTLDAAASPLAWAIALLLLSLLARRRARIAAGLVAAAVALLWLFSSGTVADALVRVVEASAVPTVREDVTYDAVIVLSGMVDEKVSRAIGRAELTAEVDRIVVGFELLRQGRARAILLSGGPPRRTAGIRTEPELLADALRAWGIDGERVAVETESRNTHENAVAAARVARERGWRTVLLVTSAAHMLRALGCFHKAGLQPDALPVDWRSAGDVAQSWLPRPKFLSQSTDALRELLGRVVYRVMGYG
jgi:uncharacterized SAM-binding protein YcdF (DUF218 family)